MKQDDGKPRSGQRRGILKGMLSGAGMATASPLVRAMESGSQRAVSKYLPDLARSLDGKAFGRDDDGYEVARGRTAYRINKPKRYPAVVVQPENDQDIVKAVRFAAEHGIKVTTRSGGHSWSASHIRNDCMLIDMSRMQTIAIDPDSRTLWTNPGVIGSRINRELDPHQLIVPTAHHPSPGIGGFCMNGGFGWNSRKWGNGAAHIRAVDVVTAQGELIRADKDQNTDYLWAARGSGAGFFGVVTNMQLTCRPLPKVWKASVYVFGAEVVEELFAWARDMVAVYPDFLEVIMMSTAHAPGSRDWSPARITLAALALSDDEDEADEALDLLKSCPVLDRATFKRENFETNLTNQYISGYRADPAGFRFAADNIYTNAPADVLAPRMRKIYTELATPMSHVFWHSWGPIKPYPDDMALSMQADVYIAAYSLWTDPAEDEAMERWPVDLMKSLDDISIGGQMNDENMLKHPQKYLTDEACAKLERLRARHDPNGVFETFMGLPYKPEK